MRKVWRVSLAMALVGMGWWLWVAAHRGPRVAGGPGVVASLRHRDVRPRVTDADLAELIRGNTAFACDLYATQPNGSNLFFSPHSLSTALAMLYAGARGRTASEMASALHFTLPPERLHPAFDRLAMDLAKHSQPESHRGAAVELKAANALWVQTGYPYRADFLDLLAVHYGAGLHEADFSAAPETARRAVNAWVGDQTDGHIRELLASQSISDATRLVLADAVYFKARWLETFWRGATKPEPFNRLDGSRVTVPMMHLQESFECAETADWQAVELPYDGVPMAMLVIVPRAGQFAQVELRLGAGLLESVQAALGTCRANLSLPRFEVRRTLDLEAGLQALGMRGVFRSGCDLSGIDGGVGDLYLSHAVHQAVVSVDEIGTVAAAATGMVIDAMSAPGRARSVEIRVDRPFIFGIRDRTTGAVLFLGRVVDPTA